MRGREEEEKEGNSREEDGIEGKTK